MGTEADAAAVDLLRSQIPFQTDGEFVLPPRGVGLVLVDLCNGFCTVGAGNLAPVAPNKQISKMVEEANRLSKLFCDRNLPIFAFLDTHYPDKPEPPYPPHCIIGTGEENFVPDLEWLEKEPNVTIKRKSCIDGYISCIEKDGSSVFVDWVGKYQIKTVLVLGICTDICVLDFASSTLAARNIDRVPPLQDVVIYSEGCATYDLPVEIAMNIKGALAHPQPILVFMSKVDGKFQFSPISVNFLTEVMKVIFAIVMLIIQSRKQKVGEKPLLARSTFIQAARNNVLLAVPALLYAINNYLKFIMQLYFNPATVKMLSNLKVLVIAVLLKFIMRRRFSVIQWEALALLLIGISINQLRTVPAGNTAFGLPVTAIAYIYTLIFVTVPSMASVYNEYALKSQYDTSIYLQNLFLYGYGAIFNFLGILGTALFQGPESFNILRGHSRATMFLICNNAAQGILSSFFFKYADTILKKYSSTVATIFTGLASAAFLGHTLTINFLLGISVVFISMHQFFSPLAKVKDDKPADLIELEDTQNHRSSESSFVNMTAGAADDASHRIGTDERQPLLPT